MFQTSGFVAKYNQDGQVLWAQKAMATNMNTCQIQDIAVDANGQVYLVGKSSDVSVVIGNLALNGSFGFSFVAKLNVNGSIAWANALNTALARDAYKVTIDVNQDVLIAGPTIYNTYVGKFASDGNQLWLKEVGNGTSSAIERFSALATDPSGSFYLLNFSFSASADKIYRVSNQGNILWAKFLVPSGNEVFGQRIFVNGIEDFTIMGNITANQSATFGTIQMPARSTDFGQDMYLARYKSLNSAPSGTLALNGTTQVCKDVSPQADYVATGVTGATAYKWTLPAGATATSGNVLSTNPTVVETTTSGITIDFTNVTLASATLKVEVSSACGAAPPATLAINLGNKPVAAGNITGTNSTCANQAVTYTTTTITGAYEYVWTFTPDDANLAATTYTSLQPSYTFTPTTNGTLAVQGRNACGTGTASSPLAIVSNAPPTITAVANSSTNCGNAGGGELKFNLAFSGAATYRVFKDGSAYSGIQSASVGELTLTGLAIGSYTVELTAGQCVVTAAASVNDGSPLITNIKTSYVSCDNAQMGLFSPATLQFDISTAQLHPEFKEYTYTVVDPQGGVIVPETTILGVTQANAASITGTQIAVTNPQRDEAYAIVIKAYKALDPNTGCSNCREVYCQVSQSFTFRGLPVSVSLQGGSPQYVCDAAGTTDVKVIVNANHDNGLSIAPAGGYRVELINESGTVVSTQEVASLTNNQLTITGVGVGSYEARVTVGKDNYACVGLAKFEVEDLEVQITVSTEAESCTNANNGKAATVVVGAKKKVTYEWQKADGTVLTDSQGGNYNSGRVEQLAPGDYKVIVTVAGICPNEKTFTIDAYAPLLDSLAVEVDTQKCEVIARAELTTAGQQDYPTGPYHVVWYQLKIDDSFSDGDQADKSKYTKVYESFEASAINATEPDLRVVLDEKYLVFKGWYYVEISGPDKCAIESDPAEIERPRKKRIFEISMRWKAPDIKPKEPELPKFDFQVAFDDAKEQLATLTEKCVQDEQAKALASFKKQCKAPEGNLTVTFEQKQHHYTLYYFDRAGQLTQTVPPAGVRLLEGNRLNRNHRPAHTMRTTYNYNSLGQMVNQHTPDGGTTNFIHDKLGRIRFSQNDKQKDESAYAYVKYDALGRTIEAGRATQTGVSFPATAFNIPNIDLNNSIAADNGFPNTGLSEQVLSFYNVPATFANDQHTGKNAFYFDQANTQTYLRNRVSYTLAYNQGSTDPVRTYFSYDPHGNVTWLIQETPGMDNGKTGNEKLNYRMHLAYDYDLISGKVLKVRFNDDASRTDRFLHRYSYDEDNRLTLVETSRDGYIWDKDAKYDYYLHGPLKRTELGEDKIQGLDYAYTIHGWIKGMNSPVLDVNQDLGGDGKAGSAFAPDVWGMSLTFYDGDYVHDPTSSFAATGSYVLKPGTHYNLYNGNIATWTSALRGVSHTQQVQRAFQYKYDRLNRIKTAHMYEWNGSNWAAATNNNALHTNYSYDGNGNLLTLQRYDKTGSLLDNLTYSYKTKSINGVAQQINQLDKVTDAVAGNKIEKEVTGTNQYDYDDIGNLIHDHAEDIVIVWNMQGKVSEVRPATASSQKPHIRYWYDASGNRLKKEVSYAPVTSNGNGGFVRSFTAAPEKVKVSYYTRDMDGNTMAIYERQYNATTSTWQTTQKELSLYGSERLGTVETNRLLSSATTTQAGLARLVGEKRYELKDHLSNVRSVVTDQKRYLEDNGSFTEYANVRTFKNYYPFGMEQPGDEIAPMLTPVTLPSGWNIYQMTGWMGSLDLDNELKAHLDYAPTTAVWQLGKDYDSKPLGTYELSFEVAFETASDNVLTVTIKDVGTDQVIEEKSYGVGDAGTQKIRYLATGTQTRVLIQLSDPTPNNGSLLEVTGIALNKTDFGDYRYGFNGKENDQEWGKLIQDYGFRLYNPAIAKFLSVDPLSPAYPELTPYQFASNRPIDGIDLDGLEWWRMALIKKVEYREIKNASDVIHTGLAVPYNAVGEGINLLPKLWNAAGDFLTGAYNKVRGIDLHNKLQSVDRSLRKAVKEGVTLKSLGKAATNPKTYESVFTTVIFGRPKAPTVAVPRFRPRGGLRSGESIKQSGKANIVHGGGRGTGGIKLAKEYEVMLDQKLPIGVKNGLNIGSKRISASELERISRKYGGIEFAQMYRTGLGKYGRGGSYYLFAGKKNIVFTPKGYNWRIINHTHPNGGAFGSMPDARSLGDVGLMGRKSYGPQKSSEVVPFGKSTVRYNGKTGVIKEGDVRSGYKRRKK
jgi:RHS repeat-associated protein